MVAFHIKNKIQFCISISIHMTDFQPPNYMYRQLTKSSGLIWYFHISTWNDFQQVFQICVNGFSLVPCTSSPVRRTLNAYVGSPPAASRTHSWLEQTSASCLRAWQKLLLMHVFLSSVMVKTLASVCVSKTHSWHYAIMFTCKNIGFSFNFFPN